MISYSTWRSYGISRASKARLVLVLILSLSAPALFPMHSQAAEQTAQNWAFCNDGSLRYEDNESSWYSGMETVRAVAGTDINLNPARQDTGIYTRECIVALIDTGVDITHPALAEGLWKNPGEIAGDGIDNDGNGYIDDLYGWNFYKDTNVMYNSRSSTEDAHGTHCAGTIIANDASLGRNGIAGGIPAVRLMPVKAVGGPNQTGTVENLIKSIQYAEQNGAAICNISLAFEKWNEDVYRVIRDSGMLFVTAAGNGESGTHGSGFDLGESPRYPACYGLDNVIVVANLKCDGTLHYSSNYSGACVDLAAPGTKINSTSTHKSGYEEMTGTSMSAPMVSAAAALVYASHKDFDVLQVKQAVLESCRKQEALNGMVKTGGMLDVAKAVFFEGTPSGDCTDSPGDIEEKPPETGNDPVEEPPKEGGESEEVRVPEATETPLQANEKPLPDTKMAGTKLTGVVSDGKGRLTINWEKVKGADGYEVVYAENKAFTKNKAVRKTAKTSLTLKNLKEGGTYYIKARAFAGQGEKKAVGTYGAWRRASLSKRPASIKKVTVTGCTEKLTVTAGSVKRAGGYEIVLSADKAGKKIAAKKRTAGGRASFADLKKKQKYFVTVRAYKKTKDGVCLYGAGKTVKVK